MVGMPWGPCNNASLNGNHPAMLAAQRCNGDVQLPYRFPITDQVHAHSCKGCDEDCDKKVPIWELAKAAQNGQSAQAGYGCDYQNKRHLIAIFEAKEWEKSQSKMIEDIMEEKPGYVGARLSKRLMTDLYGRGVCRGAVECTNLVLHAEKADPTLAESIKTAPVTDITLAYPLRLLAEIKEGQRWPQEPRRQQTDLRVHTRPKLVDCLHSTVHTSSVGFRLATQPLIYIISVIQISFVFMFLLYRAFTLITAFLNTMSGNIDHINSPCNHVNLKINDLPHALTGAHAFRLRVCEALPHEAGQASHHRRRSQGPPRE